MARVTINPPSSWAIITSTFLNINAPANSRPVIPAALTASGTSEFFGRIRLRLRTSSFGRSGEVSLGITRTQIDSTGDPGQDLSDAWETGGSLTLTASNGASVTIAAPGASDRSDPYTWNPANAAAVAAFANTVRGLSDRSLTIVIDDGAPFFGVVTGNPVVGNTGTAIAPVMVPQATGNPAPTYAVVGALPAGLAFNPRTRFISGTPTAGGNGTIRIRATNVAGSADWTVAYDFNLAPNVRIDTPTQEIFADHFLQLNATATDPDGIIASRKWTAVRAGDSTLTDVGGFSDASTEDPRWRAPRPDDNTNYILTITATDDDGRTASASVIIMVIAGVRIAGIGETEVGGESRLTREEPDTVRIAGIGSTNVGGASTLVVEEPDTVRIGGIGSTNVGGASALSREIPNAVRIAGIGSTEVGGSSELTIGFDVEIDDVTGDYAADRIQWIEADATGLGILPSDWFAAGLTDAQRRLSALVLYANGQVGVQIGGIGPGGGSDLLPDVRPDVFVRVDVPGNAIELQGVGVGTAPDQTEAYLWTPYNSDDVTAFVQYVFENVLPTDSNQISMSRRLGAVADSVRIKGIGDTAVGGAADITRVEPDAVRITGIGDTAVGGSSRLVTEIPDAIRIAGIGITSVGGSSILLLEEPDAVRIGGIGSTNVGGSSRLVKTDPVGVRISGIGITAVGGMSILSPPDITFGEITVDTDSWAPPIQWTRPFQEIYAFRTNIILSEDGSEQRIAQRGVPRIRYSYLGFLDPANFRNILRLMSKKIGDLIHVPHPRYPANVVAESKTGSMTFDVDAVPPWLTSGSLIFIESGLTNAFVRVIGVRGVTIRLADPLQRGIGPGSRVFRAVPARPENSPSVSALVPRAGTVNLRMSGDPVDNWHHGFPEAFPETLNEREYFDLDPQWASPPTIDTIPGWTDIDTARGAVAREDYTGRPVMRRRFRYLLYDEAHVERLLGLFYRARGRQKAFYMPSFMHDLSVTRDISAGDVSVGVADSDTAAAFNDNEVFRHILVRPVTGPEFRSRVSAAAPGAEGTVLSLTTPFPRDIPARDVAAVSWVNRVRFETDELTVDWLTDGVAQTTLTVRTLEDAA